jgi:hypothetical protein
VATQVQSTLRNMAPACLAAAPGDVRARWALEWPPQLVLACARAMWSSEVEAALKRGGRALSIVAERWAQSTCGLPPAPHDCCCCLHHEQHLLTTHRTLPLH